MYYCEFVNANGRYKVRGAMAFACCSPDIDARERARVSKAIDLELEQWRRDARRELFKILLVGMVVPYTLSTCMGIQVFRLSPCVIVYFSILCSVCVSIAELEVLAACHGPPKIG